MSRCRATLGTVAMHRQRGAALILFVVGTVAILGIAGLALDGGHLMLSKTRLQNAVDAAALSGAKVLDETADTVLADAAVRAMFADAANGAGSNELAEALQSGGLTLDVEFSSTLSPFAAGSSPAAYVRVRAQNFALPIWFSAVVGLAQKRVAATAVAGPSPTINEACNIMPMMVCGDPNAGPPYWGYTPGQPDVLKSSTTSGDWEVGTGNFQLIRLGDGQGGAAVREAMAGSFDGCLASNDLVETEPGNTIGPVVQGLNTRFGRYLGPMGGMQATYPPDVVVRQPIPPLDYDAQTDTIMQGGTPVTDGDQLVRGYAYYDAQVQAKNYDYPPSPDGIGSFRRREAAVAIGDCTTTVNGQGQLPLLGFGCFFLLQEAEQQGNDSYVYGEFITDCRAGGMPGPAPTTMPGPYIIQLYRDFDSTDS